MKRKTMEKNRKEREIERTFKKISKRAAKQKKETGILVQLLSFSSILSMDFS